MVHRLLGCILLLGGAAVVSARNVDLSTVPQRKSVQLTIYNSEDLTLVRETRMVTFKKGVNPLQFSWANTLIDPSSVHLRFLSSADRLEILDTTFPHDKRQMLYWNVKSDFDGEATIQISYFTSGISWSADYTAIADAEEKTAKFEGFVKIENHSGEEYEDAQVRLVVGKINLVEKIAELAKISEDDARKHTQTEAIRLSYGGVHRHGGCRKAGGPAARSHHPRGAKREAAQREADCREAVSNSDPVHPIKRSSAARASWSDICTGGCFMV